MATDSAPPPGHDPPPAPAMPPDELCSRVAPQVARELRDHGWADVAVTCRDARLHVDARCPGEPPDTPRGHVVLEPPALAALAAGLAGADEAGTP